MKIVCSFKALVRLAFWMSAFVFVAGLSLGHPGESVPKTPAPAVAVHGLEVR
jgi:hypothetical protein